MSPAPRKLALAFLVSIVAAGGPTEAGDHCATQPPPQGLVERCRSLVFIMPSPPRSEHAIRAALNAQLVGWMSRCVIAERAGRLVSEAEESVDRIFELVKDLPSHQGSVRILPVYTPLTFSEGGRTCYGVESVSFRLPGADGTVDADGDIDIVSGPTSDMVKEAAAAGRKALKDASVPQSLEMKRFIKVLVQLEKYGSDFDDTWYNVQPYASGDPMNAVACYKDFRAGQGHVCMPAADAEKACERHLAMDLVQSHHYDQVSAARFAEILEIKANDIQRSMDHLERIQRADSPGALPCPSIETFFMPKIADLARRHSVYGAGGY